MHESISVKKVVSLHIRRTDYTVNNNHPLQPMSYYEDALKLFDKNVQILVFSDDPQWCQEQELFRSCPDNVDLYGYYQSPKYFEHIKDEIKNDFKFSDEVESLCNEMYESISGKKVVSLHIRRLSLIHI